MFLVVWLDNNTCFFVFQAFEDELSPMSSSDSSLNVLFGEAEFSSSSIVSSSNRSDDSTTIVTPQSAPILKKQPSSSLTDEDLARILREYSVEYPLMLPLGNLQKMPLLGWVAISKTLLRCGMTIPLHFVLINVIDYFDLAPHQLTANSYLIIIGLYIAFRSSHLGELTIDELANLYKLKKGQDDTFYLSKMGRKAFNGLVCILGKSKTETLIFSSLNMEAMTLLGQMLIRKPIPFSRRLFFLTSFHLFIISVNRDRNSPCNFKTDRVNLFSQLTEENRDVTKLVTLSNLVLYRFYPTSAKLTVAFITISKRKG